MKGTTVALVVGWGLLLAAYVVGNPPMAAPDEIDHYVRAVGIAGGQIVADKPGALPPPVGKQERWVRQTLRAVDVPGGLDPRGLDCELRDAHASAACQNGFHASGAPARILTPVGAYQPLPYLLPAAVVRAGASPAGADRLARAASALLVLALLAAAAFALADPAEPLSRLGLIAAVTPMVIFCGASLNGSGPEIAAALAFGGGLLALGRVGTGAEVLAAGRGALGAAGAGAFVLAATRDAGPLWVVVVAGLAALLAGPGWRAWVRAAWPAGAAALAGIVCNRVWLAIEHRDATYAYRNLRAGIEKGFDEYGQALDHLVGRFGVLEFGLPLWQHLVWAVLLTVLMCAALVVAGRRGRVAIGAALAVAILLPPVFDCVFLRPTAFGLQGRHVLPVLVMLPLVAGEVLARAGLRLQRRARALLLAGVPLFAAAVQLGAWWANAHRAAVGIGGPWWFPGDASWEPPGGWWPWIFAALAGALVLAVVAGEGVVGLRQGGAGPPAQVASSGRRQRRGRRRE